MYELVYFMQKNIKISEINSKDNQIGVLYHCVGNRIGDEITSASIGTQEAKF